jgi:LCP family protein required for cell wall assembly
VHFNSNLKSTALLPSGVTQAAEIPDQFGRTAMNILLLGNAGRIDAADCALGGACDDTATSADSIMVLHLSADRSNMTVMSIPRDSIVNLPSCAHDSEDLINAALVSGPSCAVEAVHNLTGLTIDHFIEIDMAGVVTMSNALGGVPVCVTNNIYDPSTRADSAAAVAQALGIPSTAMHESGDYSEVTVVIGGDWTSGTAFSSAATATGTGAAAPTGVASSAPASSLETNAADGNACMYVPQPEW